MRQVDRNQVTSLRLNVHQMNQTGLLGSQLLAWTGTSIIVFLSFDTPSCHGSRKQKRTQLDSNLNSNPQRRENLSS